MRQDTSAAFSVEIYGEVLTDFDGEKNFEPNEICLWIGKNHIIIPLSVMELMSQEMKNIVESKALENFKKENEPDYA